ncbi:MAG: PIN domain-containing protein [Candidatus Aminicenantes bacterium]|nr:PIN domain-containing protein [Candidatus Aminicenantes bacterium]
MSDRFFLDTNVLVYGFDRASPRKRERAQALVADALTKSRGVISYQVAQEFLNVALRKFENPLTPADAQRYLKIVLEPLCAVFAGVELLHQAIEISAAWKYAFYDALIIAAALQAECSILYSEDLRHGQKIGDLRIVNPFVESSQT